MSLSQSNNLRCSLLSPNYATSSVSKVAETKPSSTSLERLDERKQRIRKMLEKVELSASSYDTAWVAMIPSPESPTAPCFPQCLNWLLDNQLSDGSWGLPQCHPSLLKDALSSTLASVLALKRWGIAESQINKGLQFIESNCASVVDEKQYTPIGFDVTFAGMIERAKDLNLNVPLRPTDVYNMMRNRDLELSSQMNSQGQEAFLAYVSEGLGKLQDLEMVMKHQRKNGSIYNSPSATAAALLHLRNPACLHYLTSILHQFGNAVPTVYPFDLCGRIDLVDTLESLGIDWHYTKEIRIVLDEAYRCWLQGDEEIFSDIATCATAFRLLRKNGYEVSPDPLSQFKEEAGFLNSLEGYLNDTGAVLELYKASEIIYPDEAVLEKLNRWTAHFLQEKLAKRLISPDKIHSHHIYQEVDHAFNFPYHTTMQRVVNRNYIEHCKKSNLRMLKAACGYSNIDNEDILKFAVEDFNSCQSIYQEELKNLERWYVESRLDKLKYSRHKLAYCYFSAAATIIPPELSDARITWAKHGLLTQVVDDFYDVGGSPEELSNFLNLLEKWNVDRSTDCCSEDVEILFLALQGAICETRDMAFAWQGRDVSDHLIEIWLDVAKSMMQEAKWSRYQIVPGFDEYLANGRPSFALGPIVPITTYFVGPKLSEEIVRSPEYNNLFNLMSTCGRLLNDIQSFKREFEQGKLNGVSLQLIGSNKNVTEEEAIRNVKRIIDGSRKELMKIVLEEKGSVVPRACKDLFWNMTKILHLFYMNSDGFSSNDSMVAAIKAVIYDPISNNFM